MVKYFSYQEAMNYMGFKTQDTSRTYIKQDLPTVQVDRLKCTSKSDTDKFVANHRVIATQDK